LRALDRDTALPVASLIHEPGTALAHRFLRQASDRAWLISPWVDTELASALAMQGRRAVISGEEWHPAWQRFQDLRQQRLQVVAPEAVDADAAASLCLVETAPLRAGDALHLARCQRHRCTLVSFDQGICAAAARHHMDVQLPRRVWITARVQLATKAAASVSAIDSADGQGYPDPPE